MPPVLVHLVDEDEVAVRHFLFSIAESGIGLQRGLEAHGDVLLAGDAEGFVEHYLVPALAERTHALRVERLGVALVLLDVERHILGSAFHAYAHFRYLIARIGLHVS